MTASEVKEILVAVDPHIERYESSRKGKNAYTVWYELGFTDHFSDGENEEILRFQIDRFTKNENDPIAAAILTALNGRDDIAYHYEVDYEPDTGYIHHIFDCEGC